MRSKMHFMVSVPVLEGVTPKEALKHLRVAIQAWGGGLNPEDPLFDGYRHASVTRLTQAELKRLGFTNPRKDAE